MTDRELFERRMARMLKRLSTRGMLVRRGGKGWRANKNAAINQALVDTAYRSIEKGDRTVLSVFWFIHQVAKDPSIVERVLGRPLNREVLVATHVEVLPEPPRTAEFVLRLLLPAQQRHQAIGDLVEEYRVHVLPKFGRSRACLWFWFQTVRSVGPALYLQLRALLKLAFLLKAAEWLRRIGG